MAHRWAWLGIVSGAYGHRVIPLAAARGGTLAGVLPLVQMRSRLFGRHLVSMPFLDTGGLCTAGDRTAEAACSSSPRSSWPGPAVRSWSCGTPPTGPSPWCPRCTRSPWWWTVRRRGRGVEADPGNRRARSARREEGGLTASVHGSEALADFYRILATNLRDLGSPMHRREFFCQIMEAFGEDARIVLVRDGDGVIGAGLMLVQGDWAGMPWVGSLRSVLRRAPRTSCSTGRSSGTPSPAGAGCSISAARRPSAGTYEAKRQWGAEPVQLFWHRLPGKESGQRRPAVAVGDRGVAAPASAGGHVPSGPPSGVGFRSDHQDLQTAPPRGCSA